MSLALLFHYLLLSIFRMLIHPSSGACDLFDELFHGLYCSVRIEVDASAYANASTSILTEQYNPCTLMHQPLSLQNNTTHAR